MAMSNMIRKELAKSRELLWYLLAGKKCCFCKKDLLTPGDQHLLRRYVRFGNCQTPPMQSLSNITEHHADENHGNNSIGNICLSHADCHKSHHAKLVFGAYHRGALHVPKWKRGNGRQSGCAAVAQNRRAA